MFVWEGRKAAWSVLSNWHVKEAVSLLHCYELCLKLKFSLDLQLSGRAQALVQKCVHKEWMLEVKHWILKLIEPGVTLW